MGLHDYLSMTFNHIRTDLARALLTILGITIGIGAIISVMSLGEGGTVRINDELNKFGINRIWIYSEKRRGGEMSSLTMGDEELLRDRMRDHIVSSAIYITSPIIVDGRTLNTEITGVENNLLGATDMEISEGRFFNEADMENARPVMVVSDEIARQLFQDGSCSGKKVMLNNQSFTIIGRQSNESLIGQTINTNVYIPITTLQSLFHLNHVDEISITVMGSADVDSVLEKANTILTSKKEKPNSYRIFSLAKELSMADRILNIFKLVIGCIAAVSLLVAGIGIMNIMLITVKERRGEIGVRKAIGASDGQIMRQFMTESLIYALIGGVFGVAFGSLATFLIARFIGVPFVISVQTVLLSTAFAAVVGLFFGIYPAMRAAKLDPVVALRNE